MDMKGTVDGYFARIKKWQEELQTLRTYILDCKLSEALKWGHPCYMHGNGNVVILQDFKEYCAILFLKGALLKDTKGILSRLGANTQAARQMRFTSVREVVKMESIVKSYIREAVALEKAGAKVPLKKTADYAVPEEFQKQLDKKPTLKKAFQSLTPGRQRAYLLYFSTAKLPATRAARVEKCSRRILMGKGLSD